MPALSELFFFITEHSALIVLVSYLKDMLDITVQRTQQFSDFSLLPIEPSYLQQMRSKWKNNVNW